MDSSSFLGTPVYSIVRIRYLNILTSLPTAPKQKWTTYGLKKKMIIFAHLKQEECSVARLF
jgi:hypothetical protein